MLHLWNVFFISSDPETLNLKPWNPSIHPSMDSSAAMKHQFVLLLILSVTLDYTYCQSNQRLKPRLQRDRRNIRPNIILILTDDQDLELGKGEKNVTTSADKLTLTKWAIELAAIELAAIELAAG